jgi:hypothetical protein
MSNRPVSDLGQESRDVRGRVDMSVGAPVGAGCCWTRVGHVGHAGGGIAGHRPAQRWTCPTGRCPTPGDLVTGTGWPTAGRRAAGGDDTVGRKGASGQQPGVPGRASGRVSGDRRDAKRRASGRSSGGSPDASARRSGGVSGKTILASGRVSGGSGCRQRPSERP